ncbi:MAG: hypothetical protein JWO38_1111 [Gemmataceae bacterium]|nr:hypothetical protein [Gemmataceae bacterium]
MIVRDQDGHPIKGAVLRVMPAGSREPAFGYPFRNYTAERSLVSDDRGRIAAVQTRSGFQFGWTEWRLFWVIPMQTGKPPEYVCSVTAEGY